MKGINKAAAFIAVAILAAACNTDSKTNTTPYYKQPESALYGLKGKVAVVYDTNYTLAVKNGDAWVPANPGSYRVNITKFNDAGKIIEGMRIAVGNGSADTNVTLYTYSNDTLGAVSFKYGSTSIRIPTGPLSYQTTSLMLAANGAAQDTLVSNTLLNSDYTEKEITTGKGNEQAAISFTYTNGVQTGISVKQGGKQYNSKFEVLGKDAQGNATAILRVEDNAAQNTLHRYGYEYHK